jgi:very-short-patch-repair endonuclease
MLIGVLRSHGLPTPARQHVIRDDTGAFVARVDLAYPDLRIAIEYDSYQEHVGKRQLVRDSRRRNAITALGWIVLVGTAEDVRLGHGRVLARDVRGARATAQARTGVTSGQ